jgi:preprotein translocase subunit SecG
MYQFILLIHVFAAVFIVALVLVQQGKGASMGAAFGAGASQTVFGSRGSGSFLFRLTIGSAAVFFATSIILNSIVSHAYKQEKVITLPALPAKTEPARAASAPSAPLTSVPASAAEIPASKSPASASEQTSTPALPSEIPTRR